MIEPIKDTESSDPRSQELESILEMAFMGLYMRDPEGNFNPVNDKYNVLIDSLKSEVEELIALREREARIAEARTYIAFPGLTPGTRLKALLEDSPVDECGLNELKKGEE